MELIDKIIAIGALALFSLPFLVIIGGAAYMVYSPKFNDYNMISECWDCKHRHEPYCAACWRCEWNPLYWVHKQPIYIGPGYISRHRLARKWRNDMQPNITRCRSCGAPIIWRTTSSGKSMPCDAYPVNIVPNPKSKNKYLDRFGKIIGGDITDAAGDHTELVHVPHWATCDKPDQFRRR